jgi:hypothetical protein
MPSLTKITFSPLCFWVELAWPVNVPRPQHRSDSAHDFRNDTDLELSIPDSRECVTRTADLIPKHRCVVSQEVCVLATAQMRNEVFTAPAHQKGSLIVCDL